MSDPRPAPPPDVLAPTLHSPSGAAFAATLIVQASSPSMPSQVDVGGIDLSEVGFDRRYEARSLLGQGGMGEVVLCRDRTIGRDVALKRIKGEGEGGASAAVIERFVREARVQGQLEHPAVVPVHDLGVAPDGRTYFTMKRVRGDALDAIVKGLAEGDSEMRARFGRRRLLDAFRTVCLAIDFAHARGVLHRDLKPANIMLGEFGEVHVLDWGVAKVLSGASDPAASEAGRVEIDTHGEATMHGSLMGTPGYMAPEQAQGRVDALDARTDVYALGVILFDLLYLEPLHRGNAIARLTSTMQPPVFEGRARRADVPPELEAICRRAVSLAPEQRHASARELAEALERYLDGERDEARRRELAKEHVEHAEAILRDAGEPGAAPPAEAMRELGRALALDPTHAGALRTLERLLTQVPEELPAGAARELADRARARRTNVLRSTAMRTLTWLLAMPLVVAFGVTNWGYGATSIAAVLGTALLAVGIWRTNRTSDAAFFSFYVASVVTIGTLSLIFGPLLLVPGFVVTNAMFFALDAPREARKWVVALGLAAIVVPYGAELVGLLPAPYEFTRDGAMILRSPMVRFDPWLTPIFLFLTSLSLVVTPTLLLGRFKDELVLAERRVISSAWHLRQLLPRESSREAGAESA
ncbi:MAG: protein kinase [Sandaracinus sp.]